MRQNMECYLLERGERLFDNSLVYISEVPLKNGISYSDKTIPVSPDTKNIK